MRFTDSRKTARNFFIAATFFEVLNHFGPIDEEVTPARTFARVAFHLTPH